MSLDPKDFERVIEEMETRKKLAQAKARDIRKATDIEGKVKVYRPASRTWVKLWPVDAAEQIKLGLAVLHPEPPEVVPPADAGDEPQAPAEPPEPVSPAEGEFD